MRIIDKSLLNEIDDRKQRIREGGLEDCLRKVYSNIDSWNSSQIIGLDSDNASREADLLPRYKEAMKYAREHYSGEFDFTLLQDLAAILEPSQRAAGKNYAEIRESIVAIPGLGYVPPADGFRVRRELEKVRLFLKDNTLHPVEEAAFVYFHIARIQPFEQANKRLASLMMNTILGSENYPAVSISQDEDLMFATLFRSAIEGYRQDMSQGDENILPRNIKVEQKAFFQFMANKVKQSLHSVEDRMYGLDKYVVDFKTRDPGLEYAAKKKVMGHLIGKKKTDCCFEVSLDRRHNRMTIAGNITYQTIEKLMKSISGLKYSIRDMREYAKDHEHV